MSPTRSFTAACVQLASDIEPDANVTAADDTIRRARDAGADFVLTPETTDMMEMKRRDAFAKARDEAAHPGLARLSALAGELGCWLLIGSLVIRLSDERLANRSFLIDPAGRVAARYDKIHMFDVEVPDGQSYRESKAYQAGGTAVVADLPWGRLGLSVCYDLRFPALYRALAHAGAEILTVPSAFTRITGRAHWHMLLRARAIETGCFVLAPAQCGETSQGRQTYGHSLIVAPWGELLAEAAEEPGMILAEVDPARVAEARAMIPALAHDRAFDPPL